MSTDNDILFNRDYLCCCASNFLFYFAFYLIVPTLALFLMETFGATGGELGGVLSAYVISAMIMRPFAAFLVDTFQRKKMLLIALSAFALVFLSYGFASGILAFMLCRIVHGIFFGMTSICSNTVVVDVIPSRRRGEGLGYYGWSNNLAMATGPILGTYLHDALPLDKRYAVIFAAAFLFSTLACVVAAFVRTKYRPPIHRAPVSLDRFFLVKGVPAGITLLLVSITYGITMNYIAIYTKMMDFDISTGYFYMWMALGIAASRVFSGKLVDRGYMARVIISGTAIATLAFLALALLPHAHIPPRIAEKLFLASAFTIGIGYGTIFPAYNTLFVALGTNNQRGSATSTYLTSWEVGVGIGIFSCGLLLGHTDMSAVYFLGVMLNIASIALFAGFASAHFNRNRVQ